MANLVNIYNKNSVPRMIKFIQSEVEKACSSFMFQPATEEMLLRMQDSTKRAVRMAQRVYGYTPFGIQDFTVTINDGSRTVYEGSWGE